MKCSMLLACAAVLCAACSHNPSTDNLPINQYQVIGSHNSYKRAIEPALMDSMIARDPRATGLQYAHIPLSDQLCLGLRNLEIDVYGDSEGGRYAHQKGLDLVPAVQPYDPDSLMPEPGFKVFHMIDVDFRSSCPTLKIALQQLRQWSDAHPHHSPVYITLEAKGKADQLKDEDGLTSMEPLTTGTFDLLDSALLAGLGEDKLITPDMVRGDFQP
nr:Ca2+-dependent phosphoinositide-specific phospholipase C [Mangrovibacterium lignilyticum]